MKTVFALAFAVIALTGCNATYRNQGSHVHVNDGYGDGHFCPPGQAKKGRC